MESCLNDMACFFFNFFFEKLKKTLYKTYSLIVSKTIYFYILNYLWRKVFKTFL
jgi:hypothetical protein